jgi:acetyltransferase-like isoleucine patch superfamily enzyme
MTINGSYAAYADSYIRVVKNGELILNSGFINEGVQIICASKITICIVVGVPAKVIKENITWH